MERLETEQAKVNRAAAVSVMALLLVLSLGNLGRLAAHDPPGDGSLFMGRRDGLVLLAGGRDLANVPQGARLTAIDGRGVESPADVARILARHQAGDVLSYHFLVDGSPLEAHVGLTSPSPRLVSHLPLFALSLLFWLAALVTLLRRPVPVGFLPLCFSIFAMLAFSFSGRLDGADLLFYGLDSLGRLLLGPAALLLALSLERPVPPAWTVRLGLLAGIPLAALALFAGLLLLDASPSWLIGVWDRDLLLLATLLCVVAAAQLGRRLVRVPAARRDRMRWGLVALLFGLVPFAATTLLPIAVAANPTQVRAFGALFLLVVPLALARSLDIVERSLARRVLEACTASTVSASAAGGAAALVLLFAAPRLPEPGTLALTLFAASAVGAIFLTGRTHSLLRARRLGPRGALQESLVAFGEELLPLRDAGEIAARACRRLGEAYDLSGAMLALDGAPLGRHGAQLGPAQVVGVTHGGISVERLRLADGATGARFRYASSQGALTVDLGPTRDGEELDRFELEGVAGFVHLLFRAVENALLFRALEDRARETARLYGENAQVIESSAVGMLLCDGVAANLAGARVRMANAKAAALVGTPRAAIDGRTLGTLLPEELVGQLVADGIERRHTLELGGRRRVLGVCTRALDDGLLLTLHDATLQATLESALSERQRIYQLGVMTAQIAHEVATPLTGVSSFAQMLERGLEDPAQIAMARKIQTQAERASEIARSVLRKVRGPIATTAEPSLHDVGRALAVLAELLEPLFAEASVALDLRLAEDLPARLVLGGPSLELEQILVNLLLNARDASAPGGRVSLRAGVTDDQLEIVVADRGAGIDPTIVDRIFDPFYTTKETGTGLGLFVARRTAAELGGTLAVESRPGAGTTMTVRLPVTRPCE